MPLSALSFLLLGCSVMLALVAMSVSQEMPVAEGHQILSERQRAWSTPGGANSSPVLHASVSSSIRGSPRGDRCWWAEDQHGTSPRQWSWPRGALGHLDLQVLILVGVAGAVPSIVGAEAGAAHLTEKRGVLLPPQPAEGTAAGVGDAEAHLVPAHPYSAATPR